MKLKDGSLNLKSVFLGNNAHFETLLSIFDHSGKSILKKLAIDRIVESNRNFLKKRQEYNDYYREGVVKILDPTGYENIVGKQKDTHSRTSAARKIYERVLNSKVLKKPLFKIEIAGSEQVFSGLTAMRAYAYWLNPDSRQNLMNGNKIQEFHMEKIKEYLGEDLVKVVEFVTSDLFRKMGLDSNTITRKMFGADMYLYDHYFPKKTLNIQGDRDIVGEETLSNRITATAVGFTKARVDTNSELDLTTMPENAFIGDISRHAEEVAKFVAYAESGRDVNTVLNSPRLKQALKVAGLSEVATKLAKISLRIDRNKPIKTPLLTRLANKYQAVALGAKLVQIPKQTTSFVLSYPEYRSWLEKMDKNQTLGWLKYNATAASYFINPKAFAKKLLFLYENSPVFRDRFDANIDLDMINSFSRRSPLGKRTMDRKISEALKLPTKIGDAYGVILGYMQVYDAALEATGSHEQAIRAFEKYDSSQQARNPLYMTIPQADGSTVGRLFTMFKSQVMLQLNNSLQAMDSMRKDYKKGGLKNIKKADAFKLYANWMLAQVMFKAVATLPMAFRRDEEDDYIIGLAQSALMGPLEGIYIVGAFFKHLGDAAVAKAKGETFDWKQLDMGVAVEDILIDFMLAGEKAIDEGEMQDLMIHSAQFFGIPAENMNTVYKGALDAGDGDWQKGFMKMMGWTEYQVEGKKKKGSAGRMKLGNRSGLGTKEKLGKREL
jgi:hypothetical protein